MTNDMIKALSGLEIAILQMDSNERKDEEFTVYDFIDRLAEDNQIVTYDTADKRLRRMAENGLLKFRLIPIKGSHTRVYSRS